MVGLGKRGKAERDVGLGRVNISLSLAYLNIWTGFLNLVWPAGLKIVAQAHFNGVGLRQAKLAAPDLSRSTLD